MRLGDLRHRDRRLAEREHDQPALRTRRQMGGSTRFGWQAAIPAWNMLTR